MKELIVLSTTLSIFLLSSTAITLLVVKGFKNAKKRMQEERKDIFWGHKSF